MSHFRYFIRSIAWLALPLGLFPASESLAQSDSDSLPPRVVQAGDASSEEEASENDSAAASAAKGEDEAAAKDSKEEDPEEKARKAEIKRLKDEREIIQARLALRDEQLKEELQDLKAERERLSLENALIRERLAAELAEAKAENDRMSAEIERLGKEVSLEGVKASKLLSEELADLRLEEERLKMENSIAQRKSEIELNELRLEDMRLKQKRAQMDMEVLELQVKLSLKEKADLVEDQITIGRDAMYLKEPYVDGVLHVSDRRIALNGLIWSGLADYVSERINYYNNESSEFPIFIVIDSSPGGSVMSGYKILKAMHGSKAPVFVIVKSYAASMAASIATLAERSFAYPNAIVLHHQISWGVSGNLTQQREFLEEAEEWWRRVARPIAEKMGLTLEEFIALMYEKNSDGDWSEFADKAVDYKWVDQIVDRIWEMSVDKNPDRFGQSRVVAQQTLQEQIDDKGNSFVALPRLEPFDFYYLYNPDQYYRMK